MTSSGNLDRDGYLMMVQGLEHMANLYKHANVPTIWMRLKRLVSQEGAAGIAYQSRKYLKRCQTAVNVELKGRIQLIKKSKFRPRTYLHLLRKKKSVHVNRGTRICRPQEGLSYAPELYFREGKVAVYTAMFGGYDHILDPVIQPDNIDYYIITDRELPQESKWIKIDPETFIPQELLGDSVLCNRWCKMHPHILFQDYEASIYLDSNLLVVSDLTPFVSLAEAFSVAMFKHWKRDCVYQEIEVCINDMRDTEKNLKRHEARLREQGIPERWGLVEAPVIARLHTDTRCISLMEDWWKNFITGSRRDQISLIETLWQNGIRPEHIATLGNNIYSCNLIIKTQHRKIVRKR